MGLVCRFGDRLRNPNGKIFLGTRIADFELLHMFSLHNRHRGGGCRHPAIPNSLIP